MVAQAAVPFFIWDMGDTLFIVFPVFYNPDQDQLRSI